MIMEEIKIFKFMVHLHHLSINLIILNNFNLKAIFLGD